MGNLTTNLSRSEFACKCGCGFDTVDIGLPGIIQAAVNHFQEKNPGMRIQVRINSGNRCAEHNKVEGGSDGSWHVKSRAADIVIYDGISGTYIIASKVADYFDFTYPDSHGIGRYHGRTHIDNRKSKARWDTT